MADSKFVYVTYIRTTIDKLWDALRLPEFTQAYWGMTLDSTWKAGSPWKMVAPSGTVPDSGEVVEVDPPRRLVISWRHHLSDEMGRGISHATFTLETMGDTVKLTVVHADEQPDSRLIAGVSTGWPRILSSLKSYLETGEPFGFLLEQSNNV